MAISSVGVKTAYTTSSSDTRAADRKAAGSGSAAVAEPTATVADHVAALDEQEPIRSVSTTQGTLVDTYL